MSLVHLNVCDCDPLRVGEDRQGQLLTPEKFKHEETSVDGPCSDDIFEYNVCPMEASSKNAIDWSTSHMKQDDTSETILFTGSPDVHLTYVYDDHDNYYDNMPSCTAQERTFAWECHREGHSISITCNEILPGSGVFVKLESGWQLQDPLIG